MKARLSVATAVLLTACSTPEQQQRDLLTDRIESLVKLPDDAGRLADYARYYTFTKNGMVMGVYTSAPQQAARKPTDTCEEMLADFSTRKTPCPSEEIGDRILAGQRAWVKGEDELPVVMDGGCSVITLIYDPRSREIQSAECNDLA